MWIFKRSIIESGANPSKVLKTRNTLFKWILKWTETQCKEANNHLTAKLLLLYEVSIFLLLCSCINKRSFTEVWWTVLFRGLKNNIGQNVWWIYLYLLKLEQVSQRSDCIAPAEWQTWTFDFLSDVTALCLFHSAPGIYDRHRK